MHTQTQIRPLHEAGGDVFRIGPSVSNLGYNLRDSWWGVPRLAVMLPVVPIQLNKLGEVHGSAERVLNPPLIKVESVRGELEPGIGNSAFEVGKEGVRRLGSSVPRHNPVRLRNQQLRRTVGKVGLL